MSPLPEPVYDWLSQHYGVVSRARLVRLGLSESAVDRRARSGALIRVHPGVYRLPGVEFGELARALAATLAVPKGAVSHTTGATIWGVRRIPDLGTHLTVDHGSSPDLDDVIVHRSTRWPRSDRVRRGDGIVVTSPPRTAFDLASVLDPDALGSVLEQLLNEGKCSVRALLGVSQRLARSGRDGSGVFRAVLASRPTGAAAVDSDLEWRLDQALRAVGLHELVRQHPVKVRGLGTIHPDLALPALRLVIEVDHSAWHVGRREAQRDRERDRKLAALGWTVLRVTEDDIAVRLDEIVDDIITVVARLSAA